jgi:hypothetical protein
MICPKRLNTVPTPGDLTTSQVDKGASAASVPGNLRFRVWSVISKVDRGFFFEGSRGFEHTSSKKKRQLSVPDKATAPAANEERAYG